MTDPAPGLLRPILGCVLCAALPLLAAETSCRTQRSVPPPPEGQSIVGGDDWLRPGNLRFGLAHPASFMPGSRIEPPPRTERRMPPQRQIDVDRMRVRDPADEVERSLRHLLDNRIDVDGMMVLRRGRVVLDYRRTGFDPASPRLLLEATHPVLAMMVVKASAEGRVDRSKGVDRVLPELGGNTGLGKLSLTRLLHGRTGLEWTPVERERWRQEAGWTPGGRLGVRAWLTARSPWPRKLEPGADLPSGPEGELLLWVAEKATRKPATGLLCELQSGIRAQDTAFWASDGQGTPLADGLALSLRDFAALGQGLLDVRARPGRRSLVPAWFVETVAGVGSSAHGLPALWRGLGEDGSWQYRFVHLGGAGRRTAILGAFGTSLYIDFDHATVVAIYATHPERTSPLLMASLRRSWEALVKTGDAREGY